MFAKHSMPFAWAVFGLLILAGCKTTERASETILARDFLPRDGLVFQYKTKSKKTPATFEGAVSKRLETQDSVAIINEHDETTIFLNKEEGLHALYPDSEQFALIMPASIEPGQSWTDETGVISELVKWFDYKAPDGETYPCAKIKITFPSSTTGDTEVTHYEYYAHRLGLVKAEYRDQGKTVRELHKLQVAAQ